MLAGLRKATAPQVGVMSAHVLQGETNVVLTDSSLTWMKHADGVIRRTAKKDGQPPGIM